MAKTCPGCGASTEFAEHYARVQEGDCTACGRTFTVVEAVPAPAPGTASEGAPAAPAGEATAVPSQDGPVCAVCGSSLSLKVLSEASLEASCPTCETVSTYVLETPGDDDRPRRRAPVREARRFGADRNDERPSRSRPCRECGGPLRFSTDDDGNVTGECGSCGNRFTLPPRRDYGGGGSERRGRPRRSDAGGGRFRRSGSWNGPSDRPRRFPPGERPYRRDGPRRDSDDSDGDDRRRRRPRRY